MASNDKSAELGASGSSSVNKRASFRQSMSKRMSFFTSRGKSGASVEQLRGTTGADFEGEGMIHRGVEGGCCGGGIFFNRDPLVERYIVIKGAFCFVFLKESSPSPQYAIKLCHMTTDKPHSSHHHHRWSVLLRNGSLGDVQYELSFAQEEAAKKFASVVGEQASLADTEETRKKLGHEHLINKRASVRYAEQVATAKVKDQPEKPVSREELMHNMEMDIGAGPAF